MKHIRLFRGSSGEPDEGMPISQRRNNRTSTVKDTKASSSGENNVNINSETTGVEASSRTQVTIVAPAEANMASISSINELMSNREDDIVTLSGRINHILVAPAPPHMKLATSLELKF